MTAGTSQTRWSLQWAWRNSTWAKQRTNGEVVPFHPGQILLAAAATISSTLSPATVIYQHPEQLTARIVNLSTARLTLAAAIATLVSAVVVFATSDSPPIYSAALVLFLLSLAVGLGTAADLVAARLARTQETSQDRPLRSLFRRTHTKATHLIIDLVRAPDSQSGFAEQFVSDIREAQPGAIVGTAPNPKVWKRVYAFQADELCRTPNGKTHFVLRQHI